MRFRQTIALLFLIAGLTAPAPTTQAAPPQAAQPILKVDEVAVGMKGYGMTVFHGTKIEPFAVEVMTINANETPGRSVIWVRCSDERMLRTGPVQGMSGSPIYLWGEDEEQTLGKGGKLIGAFAFGYGETNECIVGVQPIEYMRQVGERATAKDRPELSKAAPHGSGVALMTRLHNAGKSLELPALTQARSGILRKLYTDITPGINDKPLTDPTTVNGPHGHGQAMRMMIPMAMASNEIAQALAPTLTPLGIQPFAADPAALGGPPPKGFDVSDVKLEPGAALATPFAWGDADLTGAGTVTDVLPDGTVLAFGHAMDNVGVTAVPMATGYVHFIVSLRTISYKRAGSLELKGALVQDEQAAVAGTSDTPYTTAPVTVDVNIEGQPKRTYNYTVANHPGLTPQIAAAVVAQSVTTVQGPPNEHTLQYTTKVAFTQGHELEIKSAEIGTAGRGTAVATAQLIGALTENPFEPIELKSVKTTVDIAYGVDMFQIVSAKLNQPTAAPGETVSVTLELAGLREQTQTKTIQVTIPEDMPEGETQLMLNDAASYTPMMLQANPHLGQIDNAEELVQGLKQIFSTETTTLYVSLPTRETGLALDGQELPNLPPSKAALLTTNNPKALRYQSLHTVEHPMDRIIAGSVQLPLKIVRPRGTR